MAGKLRRRARRDVRMAIHPELAGLNRQRQQTLQDFARAIARSNSIYSQEQSALSGLPGQYKASSGAILGNLRRALSAFGGTTGGSAAENRASTGVLNSGARGVLGVLGAGQTSDLASVTAALQAAGMQRKESASNYLGQQQDALQQIASRRSDVLGQIPAMTLSRLDDLRQQAIQNALARTQEQQAQQELSLARQMAPYNIQDIQSQIAARQAATSLSQQQFGLDRRTTLAGLASDQALADYLGGAISGFLGPTAPAAPSGVSPNLSGLTIQQILDLLRRKQAQGPAPAYSYKPLP